MKVVIPAGEIIRKPQAKHKIGLRYHPEFEDQVQALLSEARKKGVTQLAWTIQLPYRPRSTGPRSQNSRIHGHAKDISEQLVDDDGAPIYTPDEVKEAMKRLAVKEGYPTKYSPIDDEVIPKPTRNASVEEAKLLSDVIQRFADEHGMWLTEYDDDGPYKSVGGRSREEMEDYWR
jgi:hypothetical protein